MSSTDRWKHRFTMTIVSVSLACSTAALSQSFSQQGPKLVATDGAATGAQGYSVSLSHDGNTAIVGAPTEGGAVVGFGSALLWQRTAGVWVQERRLVGSGAVGKAGQGSSVALSADGSTAVVGGTEDNAGTGAVWVWAKTGGGWAQQGGKLVGTGAVGKAAQGRAVALSADGNTALIGGTADSGSRGAAWVWTRSGGVWSEQAKLVGSGGSGARQGVAVALSADGNTAAVGGHTAIGFGTVGAVWVYSRKQGTWTEQAKLGGSGAVGRAEQGYSVALSADGATLIAGGPLDEYDQGAAWVWTRQGEVWTQQGLKLAGYADHGWAVSLSADGNTALVGGPGGPGAAWLWKRIGEKWSRVAILAGSGAIGDSKQGFSVALSGDRSTAIVGGWNDNRFVGAAWVFTAPGGELAQTTMVPSSARAAGAGGAFYTTDVTIANTGSTSASVTLKFLGNNADGRGGPESSFTIPAGESTTFTDVLGSVFGLTADFGAIRVTSTSAADSIRVLSQTSTPGFGGTFGQSVPAARAEDLIVLGELRSILAVREDAAFRTNLILANATEEPLHVAVNLVAQDGTALTAAATRYTLAPLGMTQVSRVVRALGVSRDVSGGRLELSTPSPGNGFAAYASVIDNATNDPRTLLPVAALASASPSADYWMVPSSARASGAGGAFYTTDLTVSYAGTAQSRYTIKFLGNNEDGRGGPEANEFLSGRKSATYADVLRSVFQRTSGFGAIRVGSQAPGSDTRLMGVLSQTWTPGFGGTFGQSVPAATSADLIRPGLPRSILAVQEDESMRTNLILANATEATLEVDVRLVSARGVELATKSYTLAPLGMTQVTKVVRDMGVVESVNAARLVLSTGTTNGAFAAYASGIDNVTNDPRTLLPR